MCSAYIEGRPSRRHCSLTKSGVNNVETVDTYTSVALVSRLSSANSAGFNFLPIDCRRIKNLLLLLIFINSFRVIFAIEFLCS